MAEFSSESCDELSDSDEQKAPGDFDLENLEERDFATPAHVEAVTQALKAKAAKLSPEQFHYFVMTLEAGMISRRENAFDALRTAIQSDPWLSTAFNLGR